MKKHHISKTKKTEPAHLDPKFVTPESTLTVPNYSVKFSNFFLKNHKECHISKTTKI